MAPSKAVGRTALTKFTSGEMLFLPSFTFPLPFRLAIPRILCAPGSNKRPWEYSLPFLNPLWHSVGCTSTQHFVYVFMWLKPISKEWLVVIYIYSGGLNDDETVDKKHRNECVFLVVVENVVKLNLVYDEK